MNLKPPEKAKTAAYTLLNGENMAQVIFGEHANPATK